MRKLIMRFLMWLPSSKPVYMRLFRKVCAGDGHAWAAYLREKRVIFKMGDDCYISIGSNITDPALLRLGNNVRISDCTIFGHDGSVNMINKAIGTKLDSVGPVIIKDNVFIGHGAIICPGVSIGPNAIVGAGSVVMRNVKEGEIVVGSPAKVVNRFEMSIDMLKIKNESWPWYSLIQQRASEYSEDIEPILREARQKYFFSSDFPIQS
jgi:acetyltransferase-like isoleucine patch superfamily enzyme